jgi:hypothetical protein
MNSVPAQDRGVASGMMSTLMNSASTMSMALFFTIVIVGIQGAFPSAIHESFISLASAQTPIMQNLADQLAGMSPTNALFSAFLGYNPMGSILSGMDHNLVAQIPQTVVETLTSNYWFPETLQQAFMPALRVSFIIGAILSGIAALLSAMRGQRYVYDEINGSTDPMTTATVQKEKT